MLKEREKEKIKLFKNLFKGRNEIFAKRWEKANKTASGYTPVCLNEWKKGICIKLHRKKCRNCNSQKYPAFDDHYIVQHLKGIETYGIYPLLDGNYSYFLAADFDGSAWRKDAVRFINKCNEYELPAYLEKSRSGNGVHVWLFFQEKYPAFKSRNIAVNILRETKIIDQFEKEGSFDRLFPNQSILSGKGIGNLIALPLQGASRKLNNTVFLDIDDEELSPFEDQWFFLENVKKISSKILDQIYERFNNDNNVKVGTKKVLSLTLKEKIYISTNNLPKPLINFLREKLNFINSEYIIKKRIGLSTYGMEKYFKLVNSETDKKISVPRGFSSELIKFLNDNDLKFELIDKRHKSEPIEFDSSLQLFPYQEDAIDDIMSSEQGILVAPPGSGKTIIGIELIARIKQPALIVTHKKQIFNQWVERIEHFLNIPKRDIGQFCANKKLIGEKATVGMVQTLNRLNENYFEEISSKTGIIIVDECHHMPAKMFRTVITKTSPFYLYGLTATPERKNNDAKLIFIYLGNILHEIEKDYKLGPRQVKSGYANTRVIIKDTYLKIPFRAKTDNFHMLSKIIVYDTNRNMQIVSDIIKEVKHGYRCLVLTERKSHVAVLGTYLKREHEIIALTGDLTEKKRKDKIKQAKAGDFQILISTGQLIGEGTDFNNLDCLFLVYPFSFTGKLTQYIGRIQRGKNTENIIYDYHDSKIEYLNRFYKKRLRYYKKHNMLEGQLNV